MQINKIPKDRIFIEMINLISDAENDTRLTIVSEVVQNVIWMKELLPEDEIQSLKSLISKQQKLIDHVRLNSLDNSNSGVLNTNSLNSKG